MFMRAARKNTHGPPKEQRIQKRIRTENNRIQKLLLSEYCDFSDTILVESPFAETTRNGCGLRQVALGLTPKRLIIAADIFSGSGSGFFCSPGLDPSIESFELVSIYPLEYVTLSVFARRKRKTLKLKLINGRTHYYELGGIHRRNIYWKIWCEQVKNLLAKKTNGSSLSETSAASSSSSSTLYLLSSGIEMKDDLAAQGKKSVRRIWAHCVGAGDGVDVTWPSKNLYFGASYNELLNGHYTPVPVRFAGTSLEEVKRELEDASPQKMLRRQHVCQSWPECRHHKYYKKTQHSVGLCDVLYVREESCHLRTASCDCSPHNTGKSQECCSCKLESRWKESHESTKSDWSQITKRSDAQRTKLSSETFVDSLEKKHVRYEDIEREQKVSNGLIKKISRFGIGVPEKCSSNLVLGPSRRDFKRLEECSRTNLEPMTMGELIERAVAIWEGKERKSRCGCPRKKIARHFRRYGISSCSHFLRAFGPWTIQPGERESIQGRRTVSVVNLRKQPVDPELKIPVSRRQLTASVSCSVLDPGSCSGTCPATRGRVILFWTPEYWYRPRAAAVAYRELRQHLTLIRNFRQNTERRHEKSLFLGRKKNGISTKIANLNNTLDEKSSSFLKRIFSANGKDTRNKDKREESKTNKEDNSIAHLRRLLKMDLRITVWDLDSTTFAKQLTLIDKDLFVQIPASEIEILVFQRSSRNAPNLGAWIAFGHRISCLTSSEILSVRKLDMRTRIIVRFINTANKCFSMGNFHSCRSILAGLQAPSIYRLKSSWSHLRVHHATRYEIMEKLCKIFRNPCSSLYQKAWSKAERSPPCIPYVGDFIIRILGLNYKSYVKKVINVPTKKSVLQRNSEVTMRKADSTKLLEMKQPPVKRCIFLATLSKLKYCKYNGNITEKEDEKLLWTKRKQQLGRKYFDRWSEIVLRSKMRNLEEERLRKMDPRRKRVLDLASWLIDCQRFAQGYNFPGHPLACEFLLKARYREDKENFFISLNTEPPDT